MNAIVRMMRVRKSISAALIGAAALVFVVLAMGSGSSPTYGDPFSGLSSTLLAEFTAGTHMMGDAFTASMAPQFHVKLTGTAPFAKVHIVKDNKYVYASEPKKRTVNLRYTDMAASKGKTSYYYVRVVQKDQQMAWASPIWVKR